MWTLLDFEGNELGDLQPMGGQAHENPNQTETLHDGKFGPDVLPKSAVKATMRRDDAPPDLLTGRIADDLVRGGDGGLFSFTVTSVEDVNKPTITINGTLEKRAR